MIKTKLQVVLNIYEKDRKFLGTSGVHWLLSVYIMWCSLIVMQSSSFVYLGNEYTQK